MLHGKCKQVDVRDLLRPKQVRVVDPLRVEQRKIIWPELMPRRDGPRAKLPGGIGKQDRPRVALLRNDPKIAVLGERTARPPLIAIATPPNPGTLMEQVPGVEEREKNVDIEQGSHVPSPSEADRPHDQTESRLRDQVRPGYARSSQA